MVPVIGVLRAVRLYAHARILEARARYHAWRVVRASKAIARHRTALDVCGEDARIGLFRADAIRRAAATRR